MDRGLYIHIPFCKSKCHYCDFCSYPTRNKQLMQDYTSELCRRMVEWQKVFKEDHFDTVYLGGGTPTALKIEDMKRIFCAVFENFNIRKDAEITVECNPATRDELYFDELASLGVNRLSIGVQSASDIELKALGRLHDFHAAAETVELARRAGIKNINIDLMLGIPHQSTASLESTLDKYISLNAEHISAYCLSVEEGTRFYKLRNTLDLANEDTLSEMYDLTSKKLVLAGYEHYEISNFAKSGYRSRHNTHTWQSREYLGVGVAAHSYVNSKRFGNSRDISAFISGEDITEEEYVLSEKDKLEEYIMLGLRLSDGISKEEFKSKFNLNFDDMFREKIKNYILSGHIKDNGERVFMTEQGWLLSNAILSELLL